MGIARIAPSEARPEMILAKPVLAMSGRIMVGENVVLTEGIIERLLASGVQDLFVFDDRAEDQIEDKKPAFVLRSEPTQEQKDFMSVHGKIMAGVKYAFDQARHLKHVPLGEISELAEQSMETLLRETGALGFLQTMRVEDDYTLRHSVNVGIIAGVIGKWMGLKEGQQEELVLAGMLHDIGKSQIPVEILNKPDKLTEAEMNLVRKHPVFGYNLLKMVEGINPSIMLAVLQHHERMDGSGYPMGLKGEKISLAAKIIAIADLYDAMTSKRVYQAAVTPFSVISEIFTEMFDKLDPEISNLFLSYLKEALVGYTVKLNNGSEAKVIYIGQQGGIKPVVQTINGEYIDLARASLNIVEIVEA